MSEYAKRRLAEIRSRSDPPPHPSVRKLEQQEQKMTTTLSDTVAVNAGLNGNGCGHDFVMTREHYNACRESKRTWYCTVCGCARMFGGKSTIEQLQGDLAAAKQREETEKHNRRAAELLLAASNESLAKERKAKARLKKRIKNGVCPCCTRTFANVASHMQTKHPEYVAEKT